MIHIILLFLFSSWLMYTYLAFYHRNLNLPYPVGLFSSQNIYGVAIQGFAVQWSIIFAVLGYAFLIFSVIQLVKNKRNYEEQMSSVSWTFIYVVFGVLTLATLL